MPKIEESEEAGMSKRILFYGDSNTYGFDPRDFWGGRYDTEKIWTNRLNRNPEWEILARGENGREIPHTALQFEWLDKILSGAAPVDLFAVMLGTNDLFQMVGGSVPAILQRMEKMLLRVMAHPAMQQEGTKLLLLAPAPIRLFGGAEEARLTEITRTWGAAYRALAEKLDIAFADVGEWDIPLAFDGVHFSEEGHEKFGIFVNNLLKLIFNK